MMMSDEVEALLATAREIQEVIAGERRYAVATGDGVALLRALADRSVDHVITDPPYEAEAHTKGRRVRRGHGLKFKPISFDAMDARTRADFGLQVGRVVKRWTLIFCQTEGVPIWRSACEAGGARHMRAMVWVKPDAQPQYTGDRPGTGYEMIETLHGPKASRWNGGGTRGVFEYACEGSRREEGDHDTPKPLPLMLRLVELFTNEGDLVVDPFCGSGATGVACARLGRRFLGCDVSPRWALETRAAIDAELTGSTARAARRGQEALFAGLL